MSFGYSVGDFISGANLTYQVIHALSSSTGTCIEYQEAINELGCMQQTFLQVGHLKQSQSLCPATINAVSHLVISSVEIIGKFLERTKLYQRRLSDNRGGMAGSWQKVGWTLFKKDELMRLRDTLHVRLNAVNVLLSTAQAQSMIPSSAEHQVEMYPSIGSQSSYPAVASVSALGPAPAYAFTHAPVSAPTPASTPVPAPAPARVPIPISTLPQPSLLPPPSPPPDTSKVDETFGTVEKMLEERAVREQIKAAEATSKKPIIFKDAVGRKFSFPFPLCNTWAGMEELIRQAFLHVDIIGPHVADGHYDLVGPNGEIILPQVWESTVQPEWAITMHMWPMPEPPKVEEPAVVDVSPPRTTSPGLLRGIVRHLTSFRV